MDVNHKISTLPIEFAPIRCPICGEVTLPNLMADGRVVCSCPSNLVLPKGALDEFSGPTGRKE